MNAATVNQEDPFVKELHREAILEIVTRRSKNGLATNKEQLLLAAKIYVENQINDGILAGFYEGKFVLKEIDGEISLKNATEEDNKHAREMSAKFQAEADLKRKAA